VPRVITGRLDSGAALLDVRAGTEHLARPGEDRHAHVVAVVERIEHLHDLVADLRVLRVDRRTVHDDRGDVVAELGLHVLKRHDLPV
jgi:hypothetical protein